VHSFNQQVPNFIEFRLVEPEMKHKDGRTYGQTRSSIILH